MFRVLAFNAALSEPACEDNHVREARAIIPAAGYRTRAGRLCAITGVSVKRFR
jgi:hypothetical protein